MQAEAISLPQQSQATQPFQFVIVRNVFDKVNWSAYSQSVDEFVRSMCKRGHYPGQKDGTAIVAAELIPGARVENKNVKAVTAIILDVDGKVRANGVESLQYVDPDDFLNRFPFRGVAHTSYNHSAALAKFRAIYPLAEPISVDEFTRLWWWTYEQTGRVCDPACKNPSRAFYLPRRPADVDASIHWVRDLPGPLLSVRAVPAGYRPPAGSAAPAMKPKTGLHVGSQTPRYYAVDPHLVLDEMLTMPLYEWAVSSCTEVSREVWRGLATNLAALVVEDPDMYEACSQAFHNISCVDTTRYEYGNCERTFRDAVNSARNVGPMTWGTMKSHGAPADACLDVGARSPVAVARFNVAKRVESRVKLDALSQLNGAVKANGQEAPSGPFIQEIAVREVRDTSPVPIRAQGVTAAKESASPPPPPSDPPTSGEGGTGPTGSWTDAASFTFDASLGEWLQWDSNGNLAAQMSDKAFTRALLAAGHDRKSAELFKCLCPHVSTQRYFYDRSERIVSENGIQYLNLYRPTDLEPLPGDWDSIRQLLINLCGGDLLGVEFLLDWIATPLQSLQNGRPWKTNTAVIFQGQPGSGKGTLTAIMRAMYGSHNTVEVTQDVLDGRFNDMVYGKLFVFCNEVTSSSNRSDETANKVKPWISDGKINVEKKYGDRKESTNNFNIYLMSNDHRPMKLDADDRRYIVFLSKKISSEITDVLWADINGDRKMVAAFFAALLARPSKLVKSQMYNTEARMDLIKRTMSSWDRFVQMILDDGWMSVSADWVASANPTGPSRVPCERDSFVPMTTMMHVYSDFCRSHGIGAGSSQLLAAAIKARMPQAEQTRIRLGKNPVRGWVGIPMDPSDDNPEPTPPAEVEPSVELSYRA